MGGSFVSTNPSSQK